MDAINTNAGADEAQFLAGLADQFVAAERATLVACRLNTRWLRRFAGEKPANSVDVAEGLADAEGQMIRYDIISASGRGVVDPATGVAPRYEWTWDVTTAEGAAAFDALGLPRDGAVVVAGYPGKTRTFASKKWGGERAATRLGGVRIAKVLDPGAGSLTTAGLAAVRK